MPTRPRGTPDRQRPPARPAPHGAAASRTARGAEVLDAPHGRAWARRPVARANGWGDALLLIDGTAYDAAASFATDGEGGHHWLVMDLRRPDGTYYRLALGPRDACDCPHATDRSLACEHLACVRAAVDWLADAERREWSESLDRAGPRGCPVLTRPRQGPGHEAAAFVPAPRVSSDDGGSKPGGPGEGRAGVQHPRRPRRRVPAVTRGGRTA